MAELALPAVRAEDHNLVLVMRGAQLSPPTISLAGRGCAAFHADESDPRCASIYFIRLSCSLASETA